MSHGNISKKGVTSPMKKKAHSKKKRHRNDSSGGAMHVSHYHPRPRSRRLRRATPPDLKTIGAAIAGGVGGAALGALIVSQNILSPESVGAGLMLGGAATAYLAGGLPRVAGMGLACVGAGQLTIGLVTKQVVASMASHTATQKASGNQLASQPPAPPPAIEPPRRSDTDGGGVVVDLFRDAALELDVFDDEWRFGMRDEPRDAAEPFVIDLDEAA